MSVSMCTLCYCYLDTFFQVGKFTRWQLVGGFSWPLYHSSLPQASTWTTGRLFHATTVSGRTMDVLLAQTGEGIKECELIQWHVQEGDTVAEFDQLCEVQSDKAAVEITSQYAGIVKKLLHQPGEMVQVGEALVRLQMEGEEADEEVASTSSDSETEQGVSDEEHAGPSIPKEGVLASPAVRSFARQHGIDLLTISGTGKDGRISKADLLGYIQNTEAASGKGARESGSAGGQRSVPDQDSEASMQRTLLEQVPYSADGLSDEELKGTVAEPLRGYRRSMVQSMTSAAAVPHFHFCDEIEMAELVELKRELETDFKKRYDIKLTYLPFILKAVSQALHDWPEINSTLSSDGKELLKHAEHNLGVAMATPKGLVVPNIKSVQELTVVQVAGEIQRLSADARAGRLRQEDLRGGTLTVSNIGAIGGTYATPIIFPPEVAIVALGRMRMVADYGRGGGIEMVPKMAVSWGADHRVIDGATLASFSSTWKSYLERKAGLFMALS